MARIHGRSITWMSDWRELTKFPQEKRPGLTDASFHAGREDVLRKRLAIQVQVGSQEDISIRNASPSGEGNLQDTTNHQSF